ncbi:hypothetical protein [Marinifilum flexuosum]|uniref:Uncharacterized protein n=1 Tax=Marinifilum flexuosum TaxID=1117708 RepID=A0A419XA50_9BACT|nr:hypothetical protein [Marinifilum flexuosum]RKE04439.1 hypothetical protein BXY64_1459 [Marinifilum flexuosum]
MKATTRQGVWVSEINENIHAIIDTNRNQIIKCEKGVPRVFQFKNEITTRHVSLMLHIFRSSALICNTCESIQETFKAKRS